ncbi:hypothetical protein D3C73_1515740 [compost metagenome]
MLHDAQQEAVHIRGIEQPGQINEQCESPRAQNIADIAQHPHSPDIGPPHFPAQGRIGVVERVAGE